MQQSPSRKHVIIYTDGACSGNPGPGGWACVLKFGEHRKEMNGYMQETTNNRMELFAAISALGALKEPCRVTLYSDSSYLVDAFEKHWIEGWRRANWVRKDGTPVPNKDLWFILMAQARKHEIQFVHVAGHSKNEENNRCDELARSAIEEWRVINSPHDEDGQLITFPSEGIRNDDKTKSGI